MISRALLLLLCCLAVSHGQEAKVRTSLSTAGDLWVGQRMTLVVELLAPGYFAGTAAFDLPNAPGLLLAPPEGHPVVSNETIDGTSFTVQRHELAAFARKPGKQAIPPFTVRFSYKRNPLDKDSVAAAIETASVPFTVKLPPGAENLGNLISARGLKVVETWKPEPSKAKVGDAFTRTIAFSAPDVPAMAFPPFATAKIDGLGIYPKAPEVLDHTDRGSLTGERRDTIVLICQRPGQFTIPAARLTWFDLDSKELRTFEFPARILDVASIPGTQDTATKQRNDDYREMLLGLALAIGTNVAAWLTWRVRKRWQPVLAVFNPVHLGPLNPRNSLAKGIRPEHKSQSGKRGTVFVTIREPH